MRLIATEILNLRTLRLLTASKQPTTKTMGRDNEITESLAVDSVSTGSVTDKQRIDWLLQECEMRRLDDNGSPYGQDLMDRSEIDAEMQSQNQ